MLSLPNRKEGVAKHLYLKLILIIRLPLSKGEGAGG